MPLGTGPRGLRLTGGSGAAFVIAAFVASPSGESAMMSRSRVTSREAREALRLWSRHRSYLFRFARASCSRARAALAFAPFGRQKARPIRAEKWRASVTRLDRESETRIRCVLYSRGFWRGFWRA